MSVAGIEHFLFVEDLEFLVYQSLLLAAIIFIYGLYRAYRRWFRPGERPPLNNIIERIGNLVRYGLLQRKVIYKPLEGTMHTMIYLGFIILFIGTLLRAFEYDILIRLFNTRLLVSTTYYIFKLLMNVGGALAIIGIIIALGKRVSYISPYLKTTTEDVAILLSLLYLLVTGFILDGISTWAYRREWIGLYDPIGLMIAGLLDTYPWVIALYRVIWLSHMLLAIFLVAYIPYTKLFHMIAGGILNTFFARDYAPSAFKAIENIDEIVEQGGVPGGGSLSMLTWKERMDYDSCIKCARCTENCPATLSGKLLSPMDLILDLRRAMDSGDYDAELVPRFIDPEVLWSCVTCGACVYQCPMLIHHVESIIDIRRYLIGKGENVPDEALEPSYNIMRYGNPMGNDPMDREVFLNELAKDLGVEVASEDIEYDYVLWLGCQVSYDPNNRGIARSLLKILRRMGVNVALLPEEACCGEPIRRLGDELLFKELVSQNGELFSRYRFKKLIVMCPHGYNVFKNEYPLYGYRIDVIHHSQILSEAIEKGLLKASGGGEKVTFHDPCYLGRWNGVYEDPRIVVRSVAGDGFTEMPRNRERSFCCGGGGGHLYFEVKRGDRISRLRMDEAIATGAEVVCTACPYCRIMLSSEAPQDIRVLDIVEYLADKIGD